MCDDCGEFAPSLLFECVCGRTYCGFCAFDSCGEYSDRRFESCRACYIDRESYESPSLWNANLDLLDENIIGFGWSSFFGRDDVQECLKVVSNVMRGKRKIHPEISIFPNSKDVFNAFRYTPLEKIRVVIVGQDCYHNPGQAHGLSFSVLEGVTPPPTLKNIFKELESDGFTIDDPSKGDLSKWAKQGVFLYNTSLTVEEGRPMSHVQIWQHFSKLVIERIVTSRERIVFVLWGAEAQRLGSSIRNAKRGHKLIESAHPSPLSAHRGFFGSRPFSRTNSFLEEPIDWSL